VLLLVAAVAQVVSDTDAYGGVTALQEAEKASASATTSLLLIIDRVFSIAL
jgi:hypothetical protein